MKKLLLNCLIGGALVLSVVQAFAQIFPQCQSAEYDENTASVKCSGGGDCPYSVSTPDCTYCINLAPLEGQTGQTCAEDESYQSTQQVWDGTCSKGTCSGGNPSGQPTVETCYYTSVSSCK
jgi:hypothetical protein